MSGLVREFCSTVSARVLRFSCPKSINQSINSNDGVSQEDREIETGAVKCGEPRFYRDLDNDQDLHIEPRQFNFCQNECTIFIFISDAQTWNGIISGISVQQSRKILVVLCHGNLWYHFRSTGVLQLNWYLTVQVSHYPWAKFIFKIQE